MKRITPANDLVRYSCRLLSIGETEKREVLKLIKEAQKNAVECCLDRTYICGIFYKEVKCRLFKQIDE